MLQRAGISKAASDNEMLHFRGLKKKWTTKRSKLNRPRHKRKAAGPQDGEPMPKVALLQ
jgi:hypothetical protein